MSRNGSGTQTSPAGSFPAVTGTTIESTKFNAVINDINASLTASIANDGQTPILANLPMSGFKHTGVAAASASGQYVEYDQFNAGIAAATPANSSVTQAKMATNVAGTGPAFSAYQSIAQTIADSTNTKVLFQTEEFDTGNMFASSRFQPTVAGYYMLVASVGTTTATTLSALYFYKPNNLGVLSLFKTCCVVAHPANNVTISGSSLIYLNGTTDYVEVWAYQQGTTPTLSADPAVTYFQGYLARAA